MIYLNEYLAVFPGANSSGKICETELNEILLKKTPNSWSRQAYVQSFYYEAINLKNL